MSTSNLFTNGVKSWQTLNVGLLESDNLLVEKLKVSDTGIETLGNAILTVQTNNDGCIWVQADRDGDFNGTSSYLGSKNGGDQVFLINMNSFGGLQLISGNTTNNTSGDIQFFSSQFINNGDNKPTMQDPLLLMQIADSEIDIFRNLDMNNNNLTNINELVPNSFKVSTINDTITAPDCLHIQRNGDACVWIQADRDGNLTGDIPSFIASKNGGNQVFLIGMSGGGSLQIASGNTANNSSGAIQFFSSQFANNGDAMPTFATSSILLMQMTNDEIDMLRQINMNTNDIIGVSALESGIIRNGLNPVIFESDINMNNNDISNVNSISSNSIKMSTVNDTITQANALHLQSNSSLFLWIQSDRDTVGSDTPSIVTTTDGGEYIFQQETSTSGVKSIQFASGGTTDNTQGRFIWFSSVFNNNGDNVPTFAGGSSALFEMNFNENISYKNLNINNNDISNVALMDVDKLTSSNLTVAVETDKGLSFTDGFIAFDAPTGGPPSPPSGGSIASLYKFGSNLNYDFGLGPWIVNRSHNYYEFVEDPIFKTASTTFTLGLTLNNTLPSGTYEIFFSCKSGTNNSSFSSEVNFVLDGITLNSSPICSALSNVIPNYTAISDTYTVYFNSAGNRIIEIFFRSSSASATAHIEDAKIIARQIAQFDLT